MMLCCSFSITLLIATTLPMIVVMVPLHTAVMKRDDFADVNLMEESQYDCKTAECILNANKGIDQTNMNR